MDVMTCQMIKRLYLSSRGDSTELFESLLDIEDDHVREEGYRYLEQCVTEKRLEWIEKNRSNIKVTDNPVWDAFEMFYLKYLRLTMPQDGEIIEKTDEKIVSRWWNFCPTLNACTHFSLDTREICRAIYEKPVQKMMEQIHTKLEFSRNYDALRPYAPFCEEMITLRK